MIVINADCGESFGPWQMGNDELLFPYIQQANIACGGHASDPVTMRKTVQLAMKHQCEIGAHVGYPDKEGFGRRAVKMNRNEITQMVLAQMGALFFMVRAEKGRLSYVKPHGALYHAMLRDPEVAHGICDALDALSGQGFEMPLVVPWMKEAAEGLGHINARLTLIRREGFLDRGYLDDGRLVPRQVEGACLTADQVHQRVDAIEQGNPIFSSTGIPLEIKADTWCVHGDHPELTSILPRLARL